MVTRALRSLLTEPRPASPPTRVWRDWLLVGALGGSVVLETFMREGFVWGPAALAATVVLAAALLWRRTYPFMIVAIVFGGLTLTSFAELAGVGPLLPYSMAWVLVLPYALLRWASGREATIGVVIMLAAVGIDLIAEFPGPVDAGVGIAILLLPAAVGASVRYRTNARAREVEQVTLLERQQLARELHDTVAHHVSAIAVQAQAGRAVADDDPAAAVEALAAIEQAASRTLDEMRAVVGALRSTAGGELGPQPGLAELHRLADGGGWPTVDVRTTGDLDDLGAPLDATVFRLAQEAVTNAMRHARDATNIEVHVAGEPDQVCLTVTDDGVPRWTGQPVSGYGLTGMAERVHLLGGSLQAGPSPEGGWRVHAALPRAGGAR